MPYCIVLTLRFMTMECPPSRTGDSVLGRNNNLDTYGKHVRFLRMSKFSMFENLPTRHHPRKMHVKVPTCDLNLLCMFNKTLLT